MTAAFIAEAEALLLAPASLDGRLAFSRRLQKQLQHRLDHASPCMLPSHHHVLPTGRERGRVVAIDLGGTTLRIAVVEMGGRRRGGGDGDGNPGEDDGVVDDGVVDDGVVDGGAADDGAVDDDAADAVLRIVNKKSWRIGQDVRSLVGKDFFLWLADRIAEATAGQLDGTGEDGGAIALALAWSFPVK
jgi:hexokinase